MFAVPVAESGMSVGSPEVSPRGEGDPATSPGCPDHHADPFDPDKPRKVRRSSLSCLSLYIRNDLTKMSLKCTSSKIPK